MGQMLWIRFASPGIAVALSVQLFLITILLNRDYVPNSLEFCLKWVLVTRGLQLVVSGALTFLALYNLHDLISITMDILSCHRILLVSDTVFTTLRFIHSDWHAMIWQLVLITTSSLLRLAVFDRGVLLLLIATNIFASIVFMLNCKFDISILYAALATARAIEVATNFFVACYVQTAVVVLFAVWIVGFKKIQ